MKKTILTVSCALFLVAGYSQDGTKKQEAKRASANTPSDEKKDVQIQAPEIKRTGESTNDKADKKNNEQNKTPEPERTSPKAH
jgi:hypothetical protein